MKDYFYLKSKQLYEVTHSKLIKKNKNSYFTLELSSNFLLTGLTMKFGKSVLYYFSSSIVSKKDVKSSFAPTKLIPEIINPSSINGSFCKVVAL